MSRFEKMKAEAREAFKERNHKATLVLDTDRFWSCDWRRADGSNEYYVNYLVDKENGNLIVTGDLGSSVACWHNSMRPHMAMRYVASIDYYMSKMTCTSDSYDYDSDDVFEDIEADVRDWNEDECIKSNDQMEEDLERIEELVPEGCYGNIFIPNDELVELIQEYCVDYWEAQSGWGKRLNIRPVLWAVGLQMAYDQLKQEGKV